MKLNWNFLGGEGVQNTKPSMEEVWIFSGTTQFFYTGIPSSEFQTKMGTSMTEFLTAPL